MDMTPVEIHKKLMDMGVSDLDAGLVVNCINSKSTYTWMNTDRVTQEQIKQVNGFLAQKGMRVKVELSEVSYQGKFIWEVKVEGKEQEVQETVRKESGPVGRFKSLSEMGL